MSDETERDDAVPPGELPRGDDMLDLVQHKALEMVLSGRGVDKEMNNGLKILADIELKRMRLKQDNDNASADRELIRGIGDLLKQDHQNPFMVSTDAPNNDMTPPQAEGQITEMQVSQENMSTTLGSPDYDEIMGKEDSDD